MGWFATLMGSGQVIEKGLDLIDDMHTSTEEEIVAKTKAKTDLLAAYAPFKLAQRGIAFAFTGVFLVCFVAVVVMTQAGIGNALELRAVISEFWIGEIMMLIVGFYFGGGAFEGFQRAKNDKK